MSYKKRGKFNNRKIIIDGLVFDSKLEGKRYQELKLMEQKGEIKDLKLQPCYELIPKFRKGKKVYRKTCYFADFSYFSVKDSKYIVEDVKRL